MFETAARAGATRNMPSREDVRAASAGCGRSRSAFAPANCGASPAVRCRAASRSACSSASFPDPGVQIIGAALLALPVRANIPIAAAMTFLTNPLTTPPL